MLHYLFGGKSCGLVGPMACACALDECRQVLSAVTHLLQPIC